MAEPFKWCFIGAGKLAHTIATEILPSGRHEIVAVYTRDYAKALAFTKKYGGTPYAEPAAAITAEDVQGVYVVTPHNSHYQYAKLALQLGKPVLCEKAFTTDGTQAKELFSLAAEKGLYLAEAMWTWFSPVAHQVKAWLDSGTFGQLKDVTFCYHADVRGYAPRLTDPNLAGGALLDIGVYPITYLYRLFGKPEKVLCTGRVEGGIDLTEEVSLTFANGQTYTASISMCDSDGGEFFSIIGTRAMLTCPSFHSAKEVELERNNGENELFGASSGRLNEFDLAAEEISMSLTESRYVPPSTTIAVMEILDECRRQLNLVYPFEQIQKTGCE